MSGDIFIALAAPNYDRHKRIALRGKSACPAFLLESTAFETIRANKQGSAEVLSYEAGFST